MQEVPAHLGSLMLERGLGESPLFAVPETGVDARGLLPDAAVSPIRDWLATIAQDERSRQSVVLQTLDGAIASLTTRAPAVADGLDLQHEALEQLWADAEKAYAEAARTVGVQTADGTLLRGEVLARWQDFVGTGEFMRTVEQKIGWLRDKLIKAGRFDAIKLEGIKDERKAVIGGGLAVRTLAGRHASLRRAHPAHSGAAGCGESLS